MEGLVEMGFRVSMEDGDLGLGFGILGKFSGLGFSDLRGFGIWL